MGNEEYYDEEYDSYYDPDENTWLEEICGDKECEFCSKRPPTPKQAKKENKKFPYRNSDVNSKRPLTPKQAKKENKKYPYRKLGRREKERFK